MRKISLTLFILSLAFSMHAQDHLKVKIGFNQASEIQYTPDQTLLCIVDGNELLFYTAGTANQVKKIKPTKGRITSLSFHDDGKHAMVATDDEVILYDFNFESERDAQIEEIASNSHMFKQKVVI